MSKKRAKSPPFVMVRKDLLKDKSFRALPSSSKVVYLYMRGKFNHKTLSDVTLTYSEVSDMFSTRTLSNAFKILESEGFIKKTHQGGGHGNSSIFNFTGKYKDFYFNGNLL